MEGCWNSDKLVALSGQIILMADPCVMGVEMKIHRFDVVTMGGNAGHVWNIDRESLFPGHSWHIGPLCLLVGLLELEMVHLFCKIAHLHESMLSTAGLRSWLFVFHHMSLLYICHWFVFHWYITMWNWQVEDLTYLDLLCSALYRYINE